MHNESSKSILIFRPYITLRDGRRLYATDVGKRAFAFWVSQKDV